MSTSGSKVVRLYPARATTWYLYNSGSSATVQEPSSTTDPASMWVYTTSDNGASITLQNLRTGQYLSTDFSATTSTATTLYVQDNSVSTSTYSSSTYVNISNSSGASSSAYTWLNMNTNGSSLYEWELDEGCIWAFEDVSAENVTTAINSLGYVNELETGKYYRLWNTLYDRIVYEYFATNGVKTTTTTDDTDGSQYFTFEQNGSNWYIKNAASQQYVGTTSTWSELYYTQSTAQTFIIESVSGTLPYPTFYFREYNKGWGMHVSQSQSYNVVAWTYNADANYYRVEEVDVTSAELTSMQSDYKTLQENLNRTASDYDFTGLFTDDLCTELSSTYSSLSDDDFLATDVVKALDEEVQTWLLKIKNSTWGTLEERFRVHEYEASSRTGAMASALNVTAYSPMYNPTGITLDAVGDAAYIFVGDAIPSDATLLVEAHTGYTDHWGTQTQTLSKGFNLFVTQYDAAQLYIYYESSDGEALSNYDDLPIHIEGGRVNGFFDCRNMADTDLATMKNESTMLTDEILDVVGNYIQWRVKGADILDNLTKPVEIMAQWDRAINLELSIMGVTACPDTITDTEGVYEDLYPRVYNNRMLCVYNGNGGNPYSTTNYTYYTDTQNFIDGAEEDDGFELWVIGHEVGHNNQGTINLGGCTEISNNLFSSAVAHEFGKVGRTTTMDYTQSVMSDGTYSWFEHVGAETFHAIQMYYSLYLYYHICGYNPLFYPKLFKLLREDKLVNHGGQTVDATDDYLKFALKACAAANEDLSEYFQLWGFLYTYDEQQSLADYSYTYYNPFDSDDAADALAEMNAYTTKANSALFFIDDFAEYNAGTRGSVDDARSVLKEDYDYGDYLTYIDATSSSDYYEYTYDSETGVFVTNASTSLVAGIKVYDADGNIIYVANTTTFTIPEALLSSVSYFVFSQTCGTDVKGTEVDEIEIQTDPDEDAQEIAEGYYRLKNYQTSGYLYTCANSTTSFNARWKTIENDDPYAIWKVTKASDWAEGNYHYTLVNVATGASITSIESAGTTTTAITSSPAAMSFDAASDYSDDTNTYYYIRLASATSGTSVYTYLHAQNWSGSSGYAVGWSTAEASAWTIEAVSEEDVNTITAAAEAYADEVEALQAMLLNKTETGEGLITNVSQLSSAMTETQEGAIDYLIDGDASTFWHSTWYNGSVDNGTHFLQVALPSDADPNAVMRFYFQRRASISDHVTSWSIYGVSTNSTETSKDDCTLLATISTPYGSSGEIIYADAFVPNGFQYLRFYAEETTNSRGYFHLAEFNIYYADDGTQTAIDEILSDSEQNLAFGITKSVYTDAMATIPGLTLQNASTTVFQGKALANVTVDRTLYSGWNTVCLPYETTVSALGATSAATYQGTQASESGNLIAYFATIEDGTIPANTPVFVYCEADGTDYLTQSMAQVSADYENITVSDENGNYNLVGTYRRYEKTESPITSNDYVCVEAGIQQAAGGNAIGAYRAFLQSVSSSTRELSFSLDGETLTGIEAAQLRDALEESIPTYDLTGRRTSANARGIVIRNGKKIINK